MNHPLASIPYQRRIFLFFSFLLITLLVMLILNITGEPLISDAAPSGIISYELAGDTSSVQAILDSWDATAKTYAGFNLGLDYLYLIFYSTAIAMGTVWVTTGWIHRKPLLNAVALLAWGQWLAALLDGVENGALMTMLANGAATPWPAVAFWCATVKFALVLIGLAYVLVAAIGRFIIVKIEIPR